MTDDSASKAENLAQMIATCWRLSQILNIPFEDACTLVSKWMTATNNAFDAKKRLSWLARF